MEHVAYVSMSRNLHPRLSGIYYIIGVIRLDKSIIANSFIHFLFLISSLYHRLVVFDAGNIFVSMYGF
jgi:hypothetical protein